MALIPSVLFLFDTTALLASKTLNWQEFAKLGECYVSASGLEQIEFMCDRASEPETERAAREFMRFYPTSGWKKTSKTAEHPALKPAPGHKLSKRARIVMDALGCAYALALRYPDRLIVVVANEQPLLQQVTGLQTKNLCGLPVPALLQWVRSQRRPPVITHHVQQMRSTQGGNKTGPSDAVGRYPNADQGWDAPKRRWAIWRSLNTSGIFSTVISWMMLLVLIGVGWRIVNPVSFNQFWQQLPLVGKPK